MLGAAVPAEVFLRFRWLIHGSVCLIIVSIAVKSLTRGVEFALRPLWVRMNIVADSFLCSAGQSCFMGDNIEGYFLFLVHVMSTETALSF